MLLKSAVRMELNAHPDLRLNNVQKSGIGPISRQWLAGPGLARAYEAAQQEQTELIIVEQVYWAPYSSADLF